MVKRWHIHQLAQASCSLLPGCAGFLIRHPGVVIGIMASRFGRAKPRGVTWNGAGGCVIFSHSRH